MSCFPHCPLNACQCSRFELPRYKNSKTRALRKPHQEDGTEPNQTAPSSLLTAGGPSLRHTPASGPCSLPALNAVTRHSPPRVSKRVFVLKRMVWKGVSPRAATSPPALCAGRQLTTGSGHTSSHFAHSVGHLQVTGGRCRLGPSCGCVRPLVSTWVRFLKRWREGAWKKPGLGHHRPSVSGFSTSTWGELMTNGALSTEHGPTCDLTEVITQCQQDGASEPTRSHRGHFSVTAGCTASVPGIKVRLDRGDV